MTKSVLICLIFISTSLKADTQLLPKNVRAFAYKFYNASVPGTFGDDGLQKDFRIRETLGTQVIRGISTKVSGAYDELHGIAPQVAENLNLGRVNFDPNVNVTANVFGMAWGLTDKLMVVAGIPLMQASVQVRGGYINDGAVRAAAQNLRAMEFSDEGTKQKALALAQVLEQLPVVKGENLQNVIVNQFGYKPVGDWTATDVGDAKIYFQNKFIDGDKYKAGARLGMDIPTGKTDDPDNLMDVPFGAGYYATFLESLNDFPLLGEVLLLSVNAKYQYNWATERTYRLPQSKSFPLTSLKEEVFFKPGNLWTAGVDLSSKIWRNVETMVSYVYKNKALDSIRGKSSYNYGLLEQETDYQSHTVEFSVAYSTVNSFLQKKFLLPLKVGLTYSYILAGVNTENVRLLGLNLQAYF